jgi:hypothetical protein
MDFYPPFEERDTDFLIVLANSEDDFWQLEAIDLAKKELARRKISIEEQKEKIKSWSMEFDELEKGFKGETKSQ